MNIIITTFGSAGDVHPFVALGVEAIRRGHQCTIITNGKFRGVIERNGIQFIEVGTEEYYNQLIHDPRLWDPNRALELLLQSLATSLEPALAAIEASHRGGDGRTLLIGASLGFAARVARDQLKLPMVSVHLAPSLFWSAKAPPLFTPQVAFLRKLPAPIVRGFFRVMDVVIDFRFSGALQRSLRSVGYPEVDRLFSTWIHSPDLTVGMFPDWFASPQSDWPSPCFLSGFPLFCESRDSGRESGMLEHFLASGPAPVAFAPGSANHQGWKFFRQALAACEALQCRGVFISPAGESIPPSLPSTVMHVPYVPFEQLFPRCAAVVHHGGIGTTAQCLAAGMPQLIMPMAHDQFDNAERLQKLGVALTVPEKDFAEPRVSRALSRLLEAPSFRRSATALREGAAQSTKWDELFARFVALTNEQQ